MKKLLTIFAVLCSLSSMAQRPGLVSLKAFGGNRADAAASATPTADGGFIVAIGTRSGADTGNIDTLFCNDPIGRTIFVKYNSDATVQEWSKCYEVTGDTMFYYMFPQSDGGFIFGGQYGNVGIGGTELGFDIGFANGFYVCKQDALGNILWSHIYGGEPSSGLFVAGMMPTPDGGYALIGDILGDDSDFTNHSSGGITSDIGVLKIDSLGNKQWSGTYGGTAFEDVASILCDRAGGYYVLGHTMSNDLDATGNHDTSGHTSDLYLLHLDSVGNIIWHKDMGGSTSDFGDFMLPDGNGGAIIAGDALSVDGDVSNPIGHAGYHLESIWLLDVDRSGNKLWDKCLGGGYDQATYMCHAADGSIWIAATNQYRDSFEVDTFYANTLVGSGPGAGDAWFVHTDSVGNFLGGRVIGSNGDDRPNFVYPLSNGNVMGGGYYTDSSVMFSPFTYYGAYGAGDAFLCILAPTAITEVKMVSSGEVTGLFPNPAHNELNINASCTINEVVISNILGQVVYSHSCNSKQVKVDIAALQSGVYFIKINGSEVRKFMKS